ncbi:MAG TPA: anti-sigma factor [Chloroflexota bacterium]|nr:anti-sigma factor [Chloroflexota bacterium]
MSEHEELENSIAAWVLGAADAGEADTIAIHVDGCPSCQVTASRLTRAIDALPLEVEELEPPARLRQRILAAASTSPRVVPMPSRTEARSLRLPSRRKHLEVRMFERIPLYAAAAAVLLALVAGVAVGQLAGHFTPPAQSQVARFMLVGHDSMAGARASVVDLKSDGIALVDFNGLPALETGKVYELWLITPGNRIDPAGVFVPDASGTKVVVVGRSLEGYKTMAVTTEQGPDGAAAPTQQPQLYGSVA